MDKRSPGISGNSRNQVPGSTHSRQVASHSTLYLQDRAPSSVNPSSNQGLAVRPADSSTLPGQATANSALHTALYRQGPGFAPNRNPSPGYPGHPLQDKSLQRPTTYDGISQTAFQSEQDYLNHRNVTAPAVSHPSIRGDGRQMGLDGLYRHGEAALQREHEEDDMPDWSAMGHERDPHELFLFGNEETCNTVPDGVDTKVSWWLLTPVVVAKILIGFHAPGFEPRYPGCGL